MSVGRCMSSTLAFATRSRNPARRRCSASPAAKQICFETLSPVSGCSRWRLRFRRTPGRSRMRWRNGVDAGPGPADLYRFGPDLVLSVRGDRRARAHFRAEYASAALDNERSVPAVEATVGSHVHDSRARGGTHAAELRGTHKLAR